MAQISTNTTVHKFRPPGAQASTPRCVEHSSDPPERKLVIPNEVRNPLFAGRAQAASAQHECRQPPNPNQSALSAANSSQRAHSCASWHSLLATVHRQRIFPLAPTHVTWYKQFRREHLCGCVRRFLATLAACLASKFQKAVIDPGHGIRIRGQSSSKGFERTSK